MLTWPIEGVQIVHVRSVPAVQVNPVKNCRKDSFHDDCENLSNNRKSSYCQLVLNSPVGWGLSDLPRGLDQLNLSARRSVAKRAHTHSIRSRRQYILLRAVCQSKHWIQHVSRRVSEDYHKPVRGQEAARTFIAVASRQLHANL